MHLSDALLVTLSAHSILTEDYRPAYGGESVGLDLYNASPNRIVIPPMHLSNDDALNTNSWENVSKEIRDIKSKALIPTGLKLALPRGHVALLRERGSIIKTPLILRAGVIDPGYTDQIFVNMVNTSNVDYLIEPMAKLPVQLLVLPVIDHFRAVTMEEYQANTQNAQRQTGKVGSTG